MDGKIVQEHERFTVLVQYVELENDKMAVRAVLTFPKRDDGKRKPAIVGPLYEGSLSNAAVKDVLKKYMLN